MTFLTIMAIIGAFGWGMFAQEIIQKRDRVKARHGRIVIDAPFSPEQSETIMRVLVELNEAVRQSTMKEPLNKKQESED
jgi:hypothetical protein